VLLRKIADELVIAKVMEEREPGEDTHWSTSLMTAVIWVSQSAISRIWRAFGLKAAPGGHLEVKHRTAVHPACPPLLDPPEKTNVVEKS
jgi:hypothetical protein